jgi:DNA segregation ATPase FtsK/SpoIIIE, S-DNA-T family
MARRKTRKSSRRKRKSDLNPQTRRQISGVIQVCAGVLLLLVLRNEAGALGGSLSNILVFFFGAWSLIFPLMLIASGVFSWAASESRIEIKRSAGLLLGLIAFLGLMHIGAPLEDIALKRDELAGAIGFMVTFPFIAFASKAVGYTVLTGLLIVGGILAFEPKVSVFTHLLSLVKRKKSKKRLSRKELDEWEDEYEEEEDEYDEDDEEEDEDDEEEEDEEDLELNIVRPDFASKKIAKEKADKLVKDRIKGVMEMKDTRFEEWEFPTFDLLDDTQGELKVNDEELKMQAKLIEEKLEEFDIDVVVRDARPGPTVTQFTLDPAEGVRLSKIANLKDDLALALAAQTLRIEAPIPGKSLVGIEMPNSDRTIVHLKEILESDGFHENTSPLALPLGRDVAGVYRHRS